MIKFIKNCYPELLVFGFIAAILMIDLNPDYTFMNKAADSIGYAYSAKYLYPSFHTSPPLYLLISHFFLKIPYGTEAWRMGLVSVLSTIGASIFIYYSIRVLLANNKNKRWFSLLGVLVYGTSAIVISQSIIIETYALVSFMAIGAYYFAITKHWKLMGLMLGLGLIVHLLAFFVALILILAYKEFRHNWKAIAIMSVFLVFYAYIPITNRPPYMWIPDPATVNTNYPPLLVSVYSFVVDTLSTVGFLIGKLSIYDIPKRIFDIIGIVGVSIGVVTIIPIVYFFWKTKYYTKVLFWLILTPVFIFLIELDMNTYDYIMIAMPFLAIVTALGMSKLIDNHGKNAIRLGYVVVVVIVGFGLFNLNYFDIGRTEDKNLSASNFYYNELAKIPDGAIFMPNGAWEWEAIFKYNKDYNKHIIPVSIDILPSRQYTEILKKEGIKLVVGSDTNASIQARQTAMSIIELNDNVWTTVYTDPSTFASEVVNANHNVELVNIYDVNYANHLAQHPTVKWKPYNPYSILTTSITIQQWNYVLLSNRNISVVILSTAIAYGIFNVIFGIWRKNKKSKLSVND